MRKKIRAGTSVSPMLRPAQMCACSTGKWTGKIRRRMCVEGRRSLAIITPYRMKGWKRTVGKTHN